MKQPPHWSRVDLWEMKMKKKKEFIPTTTSNITFGGSLIWNQAHLV